jgi:hypothetical protein
MEGNRTGFDAVGVRGHPIAGGEPGGTENQKLSHRGSVSPGKCVTEAGEGGGRFNGGE